MKIVLILNSAKLYAETKNFATFKVKHQIKLYRQWCICICMKKILAFWRNNGLCLKFEVSICTK